MKLFVSWHGELSKEIGSKFKAWFPKVLQCVKPYFSPDDIDKGMRWDNEIAKELEKSDFGIILLTKENFESSWIMFEAGAISKKFQKSRICPILFELEPEDLKGPLAQFQASKYNQEEIEKLVKSLNSVCEEIVVDNSVLKDIFNKFWPDLDSEINSVIGKYKGRIEIPKREESDIINEILDSVRFIMRNSGNSTSGEINLNAFKDLYQIYNKIIDSYNLGDFESLGFLLDELQPPLSYLSSKTNVYFDKHPISRKDLKIK